MEEKEEQVLKYRRTEKSTDIHELVRRGEIEAKPTTPLPLLHINKSTSIKQLIHSCLLHPVMFVP
jgi:hypothetical protein